MKGRAMSDAQIVTTEGADEPTIGSILSVAQEKGITGDDLNRYLDFAERVESNRAKKEYAAAMHEAQAAMPVVVKDQVNNHTNSRYASMEKVQKSIKKVYLDHGFSVSFSEKEHPRDGWVRVVATVMHTGGHTERYHKDGPVDDKGPKGNAVKTELHGAVSAGTLLSRHLLCGIFGVTVANTDDDGNMGESKSIDEKQVVVIDGILSAFDDSAGERARLLGWALPNVAPDDRRLEDIPSNKYERAVKVLNNKLEGRL